MRKTSSNKTICKHCEFLEKVFNVKDITPREYWIFTEIFTYLHDGKDYCTDIESNKKHDSN